MCVRMCVCWLVDKKESSGGIKVCDRIGRSKPSVTARLSPGGLWVRRLVCVCVFECMSVRKR